MKHKILTLVMISVLSLVSCELFSQSNEYVETSSTREQDTAAQVEQINDEQRLSELKEDKKEAADKAKEAKIEEQRASTAARETKMALKAERKAQKARDRADRQARRAELAKAKVND